MTACEVAHAKLLGQQLMHRFHIVADGRHREARTVEWLRCIAGRRRAPIAKQLRGDEKLPLGVERLSGADEKAITTHIGHVVRRQKNWRCLPRRSGVQKCRRQSSLRVT